MEIRKPSTIHSTIPLCKNECSCQVKLSKVPITLQLAVSLIITEAYVNPNSHPKIEL